MSDQIRELAAWPLDEYPHRPEEVNQPGVPQDHLSAAKVIVGSVSTLAQLPTPPALHALLNQHATRPDLLRETANLPWSLALIDLTHLQTFQRRLTLPIPAAPENTWPALVALNFAQPRTPQYTSNPSGTILTSPDPNLQVSHNPFRIHTGSPFFEVATYRSRWFLRDGYHRAYALLRAGITQVPALLLHARTLHELNANKPPFFPDSVLFGPRPPLVTDFLDDALNITYTRPPHLTTIRVKVESGVPL